MKSPSIKSILAYGLAALFACFLLSSCYIFYDGSLDGFTIDGIYDGGRSTDIALCPDDAVTGNLLYSHDSFDYPTDPKAGSLSYFVSGGCFPDDAPTGFSRFDFVSPDLASWNDVTGYDFTMKSFVPDVQVQPLIVVRKADGRIVSHRMVDEGGRAVYIELPNDWGWHTYRYERPVIDAADNVIELRVRVFVPNSAAAILGVDSFIYLDTVLPIRP